MAQVKRRAVSHEQKAQRRTDILKSAKELFKQCQRYDDILMKQIAENIGLTKGTLYLYFKTKEEVFLAVYQEEFIGLCQRIESRLSEYERPLSNDELHSVLVESVLGHNTFLRLNALLHAVLEQNIAYEAALSFKLALRDRMLETVACLERHVPVLKSLNGAEFMLLVHEVLLGTYHAATPSPCLDKVFEQDDMAFMKLHFEEEFPKLLKLVIKGYMSV